MRGFAPFPALVSLGLIGVCAATVADAAERKQDKGAKIYCYMRSSGNDHAVSWNAAYAVIKRQGKGPFKTSPQHASVMITESVVNDPGNFPDCGQFLGDLFGGSTQTSISSGRTSPAPTSDSPSSSETFDENRYSY